MGRGAESRETRFHQATQAVAGGADLGAPDSPFSLSDEEDELVAATLASNPYRQKGNYCKPLLALISLADRVSEAPASLKGYTIEHILPRNPTGNDYWQRHFPIPKVREAAIRSLGNLALVTDAQNRKVKNAEYPDKLAVYFRDGDTSPFDTTRMLKDIADWTPKAVLARETLMFERAAKAWSIRSKVRSKLAMLLKP
jgi:hypothetical protein